MSSITGPLITATSTPAVDGSLAHSASALRSTARAVAVRAGQLLVWILVTAPIALVLLVLCLGAIGALLALVMG